MTLRPILFSDNPILRRKSHRVPRVTGETRQLIEDMFETMRAAQGVGLAAVQIGIPMRVIVIEIPEDLEDPDAGRRLALINPELARVSNEMEEGIEGCLSVPGWMGEVSRHLGVTVKGLDPRGKKVRVRARGYLARVLQHEIDHLNGVLFIDRASEVWQVEEGEEERLEAEAAAQGAAGATPGMLV
ncbi:MAG TPA: peptide deformylase [Anaerolineales bacterium]|nr:peptide deformylase [Anaerolineae bacterium]HIQ02175.1 peptide deformylase [Anaerolineales bacterium]